MERRDTERDLTFLGFIIFENKLKSGTAKTIAELNHAGIRNIMCTGDNILTAISVARECGLISKDEKCFIPHFVEGWWFLIYRDRSLTFWRLFTWRVFTILGKRRWFKFYAWPKYINGNHSLKTAFFEVTKWENQETDSLQPSLDSSGIDLSVPTNACNIGKYSLAVTGDVFRWMLEYGSETVVKRVSFHFQHFLTWFNQI